MQLGSLDVEWIQVTSKLGTTIPSTPNLPTSIDSIRNS